MIVAPVVVIPLMLSKNALLGAANSPVPASTNAPRPAPHSHDSATMR